MPIQYLVRAACAVVFKGPYWLRQFMTAKRVRLLLCLCLCFVGCSRRWFRRQADQETAAAISEKGGYLDGGSIYPASASRLHDPFAADRPPMPPDDPQSHQLMRCVDGKRGYKRWGKFGYTPTIESSQWVETLPRDERGEVQLDLREAVRIARVNSREYQRNLETLYLSALDVTLERFQFDHQLFAGNRLNQDFRGSEVGAGSETRLDSFAGFSKLSATGGELVTGFANSLVWDSWGSGSELFRSTLDFTLIQPLLRFGGRARVLELLTQSERDLLANVRQMEQFRQGFYVNITTGRNSGSGPTLGGNVSQAGLGVIAGFPSGRNGAPPAGGYLGLLQDQQEIRNQESTIAALRDSLAQLEAAFDANRISSRLQVDQARQALLNAQSGLLVSKAAYQSRLDDYKISLGLPPDIPVQIHDPLLERFVLIDPKLTQLQDALSTILLTMRRGRNDPTSELIDTSLQQLEQLDQRIDEQIGDAAARLKQFRQRIPERKIQLEKVAQQARLLKADVDPRVYDHESLEQRFQFLQQRVPAIETEIQDIRRERAELTQDRSGSNLPKVHEQLISLATRASDLLLELSLIQAETKLQGITLLPLEIEATQAIGMARVHRLDWMNARANVVDSWRKIEFFANDLKSDLDIVIDGQLGTEPDKILDFDSDHSRVRFGLEFDSPAARLAERNRYRASLIRYQQARRGYMLFEDRVKQSLRNTVRIIKLSQINLEVRRVAVEVAIAQYDMARLRLNPPVRPNQPTRTSPTAARDLLSALNDLLDAQNDLLNVWVSYEVLRVLLDFEMGTMQLDPTGVWIDPGPLQIEELPPLEGGFLEDSRLPGSDLDHMIH